MSDLYANQNRGRGSVVRWRFAGILAVAVALPLILTNCETILPKSAWNGDWGPLVPHETFPGDCSICHHPGGWDRVKSDFSFDHFAETGYALLGAHEDAMCLRCHNDRGSVESFSDRGCGGCHVDPHRTQLGSDCEQCHEVESWEPIGIIEEHAATRLPLFGAHLTASCDSYHPGSEHGEFRGAPTLCEVCHANDVVRATSPNHLSSGLTTDCGRCHSPFGWEGAGFDHDFFPLAGGHSGHDCEACHPGEVFTGTSSDCYSCHTNDFNNAPNHQSYSTQCQDCHDIFDWGNAQIDHSFFPLAGGHAAPACEQCHIGGVFAGTDDSCFSCHSQDYTTAPGHSSYSTQCQDCHDIFDWGNAQFDHSFFPLIGGHSGQNCEQCHTGGVYAGTDDSCFSCHAQDYNTAPGHSAYSTQCQDCHDIFNWGSAQIDHSFFPLSGGHATPTCDDCHSSGVFQGLPSDCLSCHQSAFNGASDHVALSLGPDCLECHTINNWNDNFQHDFPRSGPHNRDCTDCHVTGTTADFSCYGTCHEHTVSRCANDHSGVNNYSYSFPACLACHPDGDN